MDLEDAQCLWQLELPSILGMAAPGSEVLDAGESASFDLDYDSSEEARYEQEAIAADEELDALMGSSTGSFACSVSGSDHSFRLAVQTSIQPPSICYNTLLPENVDLGCFQPKTAIESEAKKALMRGLMPGELVASMVDMLPSSTRSIHGLDHFGSCLAPRAFTAGAFIHGPYAGLHTVTMEYELAVLMLVSVVRGMRPDMAFSTVSLLRNLKADIHRDCHNHAQTCNFVLPMTHFSGGEIFVEDSNGASSMGPWSIKGSVLPLLVDSEPSPVEFCPRLWHCNLPWGGERVILVAFHIRNPERLPGDAALQLGRMGFRLRRK